jgi:hypothetical protein
LRLTVRHPQVLVAPAILGALGSLAQYLLLVVAGQQWAYWPGMWILFYTPASISFGEQIERVRRDELARRDQRSGEQLAEVALADLAGGGAGEVGHQDQAGGGLVDGQAPGQGVGHQVLEQRDGEGLG